MSTTKAALSGQVVARRVFLSAKIFSKQTVLYKEQSHGHLFEKATKSVTIEYDKTIHKVRNRKLL